MTIRSTTHGLPEKILHEKHGVHENECFDNARDVQYLLKSPAFKAAKEKMEQFGADLQDLFDREQRDTIMVPTLIDLSSDLGDKSVINVPLGHYSKDQDVT